jgi:curved DNA-binding protein CbpA
MRSAYIALGVPGDATAPEIEAAFRNAEKLFTRERLVQEEGALRRLEELKAAYQILRDPAARAAHDRKLQEGARAAPRTVIVQRVEEPSGNRLLTSILWLAGLAIVVGATVSWRNAEARKEQELAARKEAERAAVREREEERAQVARRAALDAQAEANERQLRQEAQYSAARAAADIRAQEAQVASARRQEQADQQRQDQQRRYEEQRAAQEARMRVERDKQRVRELCMLQYRRPDC